MGNKTFKPIIDESTFNSLKPYYGYSRVSQDGKNRPYFILTTEQQKPTLLDGVEIQCSARPAGYQTPDKLYLETTLSGWEGLQSKCDDGSGTYKFYCFQDSSNQHILTLESYQQHYSHFNPNGDIVD